MAHSISHHEVRLRERAHASCAALLDLSNNPPPKILSDQFTSSNPQITEHGPDWAKNRLPFLGRTFAGTGGCIEYFTLLGQTLQLIPNANTFPDKEGIIVDERAIVGSKHVGQGFGWDGRGVVSLADNATFEAVETGRKWDEVFIYRLSDFDEDGKIGHWEIWADPLSAWAAVGGEQLD